MSTRAPARNPIFSLLARTWEHAEGRRGRMVLFILLSALGSSVALLSPLFIGRAFDAVQFEANDPRILSNVVFNIGMTLALTVAFWAMHGTSRVIEDSNAFFVEKHFRERLFGRVLALPSAWHRDHHSGESIDKVAKAAGALRSFASAIFNYVSMAVRLIGSVALLTYFDWRAGVAAVVFSSVTLLALTRFDAALRRQYRTVFGFENALSAALFDALSNIRTVLTLRLEPSVAAEVAKRGGAAYPATWRSLVINEFKWFTASFAVSLMTVGVLIANAYSSFAAEGVVVLSTLFLLYQYLSQVGDVFYDVAWRYGGSVTQETAVRAAESIDEAYAALVPPVAATLPEEWKELAIEDLRFRYPVQDPNQPDAPRGHLDGVSLTLHRGERIAVIGESGGGKSTFLSLLRGLDAPEAGTLRCDGVLLPHGLAHLAPYVTLIPQEPELFNSTVEANITMDIYQDTAELERAIDLAQFRDVLPLLPMGLASNVLEKGVSLSGGQKQRLALARGILAARSSDILLLDEPTSSVDPANERAVYENLFAAFPEKTIVAALHRLPLLPLFDRVVVLAHGTVVTAGTPDEVMRHDAYHALERKSARTSPSGGNA